MTARVKRTGRVKYRWMRIWILCFIALWVAVALLYATLKEIEARMERLERAIDSVPAYTVLHTKDGR